MMGKNDTKDLKKTKLQMSKETQRKAAVKEEEVRRRERTVCHVGRPPSSSSGV